MPFVALLAPVSPTAAEVLDAAARAHASLKRYRVEATLNANTQTGSGRQAYDVTSDGMTVLLRIREPQSPGRGAADRSFHFRPNRVDAYDRMADERLTRAIPPIATWAERATYVLGPIDELLTLILNGKAAKAQFANYRGLSSWKVTETAASTKLTRRVKAPGGTNLTILQFAPRTGLLTSLTIRTPDSSTHWTLKYQPPTTPKLAIPARAREVEAFTLAPEPPKYVGPAAKPLVDSMFRAYSELRRVTLMIANGKTRSFVTLDGNRVAEANDTLGFGYDGRTLTVVVPRTRSFYQGRIARRDVPEVIAELKGEMHPLTRQYLRGRTPMRELLGPEMEVSVTGTMRTPLGVACDILSARSRAVRMLLMVRRDNHLLDASTSTTLDADGQPVTNTTHRFRYLGLGKESPDATFRLRPPVNYRVLPLPPIPPSGFRG
jgi:hypothetical protein